MYEKPRVNVKVEPRSTFTFKGGFPLSRNFYVRTDVNFNWLYVRKAWFPYRSICRICRVCSTKKIHRRSTTLWKPPVQLLNTIEMTTFCTR